MLNLGIPGENCLFSNWHSYRAAPGISFFRAPKKDDEYSTNWKNNIIAVITCNKVMKAI